MGRYCSPRWKERTEIAQYLKIMVNKATRLNLESFTITAANRWSISYYTEELNRHDWEVDGRELIPGRGYVVHCVKSIHRR